MNKLVSLILTIVLLAPNFAFAQNVSELEKLASQIKTAVANAEQSAKILFDNPFSQHSLNSSAYGRINDGERLIYDAVARNGKNDLFIYSVKKQLPQKAQRDYLERVLMATRSNSGPVKAIGVLYADVGFTERIAKMLLKKGRMNFSRLTFEVQKRLGVSYDRAVALALNTEIYIARTAVENAIALEVQNAKLYSRHSMMRIFDGSLPAGMRKEAARNISFHYKRVKNLYKISSANNKTVIQRVFGKAELKQISTILEHAPVTEKAFVGLRNKLFVQKLIRRATYSIPAAAAALIFVSVLPKESYSNADHYESVISNTVKAKTQRMQQYKEVINAYPELVLIVASADTVSAKEMEELLFRKDGQSKPLSELLPFLAWSAEYMAIPTQSEQAVEEYTKNVSHLNSEILEELATEKKNTFLSQLKSFKYPQENKTKQNLMFFMEK